MFRRSRGAAIGLLLVVGGCEFGLVDWYYIDRPRIFGARIEVVEFSPKWPERIGYDPLDPPITEALPGDRVALEPLVVDEDGRELDPAELDAMWLQCGATRCSDLLDLDMAELSDELEIDCAALPEWTMDSRCRLGRTGHLEYVLPTLAQATVDWRFTYYYLVVSVGSQSVDECWAARRDGRGSTDGCLYADRELKVGPSWVLLAEAAEQGLVSDIPIEEIPAAVYTQPANRVPWVGELPVEVHGETTLVGPTGPAVRVARGDRFEIEPPLWRTLYDFQIYFQASPLATPGNWVFVPGPPEYIWSQWFTSGSLIRLDAGDFTIARLAIDEQAKVGSISRLVFLYGDERGSMDMRVIEFEVVE